MWHSVYAVTVAVVVVVVGAGGEIAELPAPVAAQRQGGELAEFPHPVAAQRQATSLVRPVDCADHLLHGATTSGVYEIFPFTCTCGRPVLVWCDMETDGGGWTVFLNRQNQTDQPARQMNQLDFNVTWDAYKAGFGSPYKEYYLGNELLHQMTYSRAYAVRLDMELASGGYDYATYQSFKVSSEDTRYSASLSGTQTGDSSIRNCFRLMSGRAFTTLDRDHDSYGSNCAATQGGAWWYYNCRYFNPTSTYNNTLDITCYGTTRSVTQLQIKLRPSICDASFKTIHLNDKNCGCENSATDTTTTTTTTTTSTPPTSTTTTSTTLKTDPPPPTTTSTTPAAARKIVRDS
ncbi:Ryncolin-2 [Chionoecetes opilio]|uniref:Ryncolin-2 n=1 Tax=Chionoecetes opilio TaxID=41210 RepID=A0A8J4YL91_CHIOP|nr:Ryncolin-2 [Chionoecetes opilio]